MAGALAGKRILVVEDEILIGRMLCQEIECAGASSFGPTSTIGGAIAIIEREKVDAVILDAKLGRELSTALAASLHEWQIPFVVTSGYERSSLPAALRVAPFIGKPISVPSIIEALARVVQGSVTSPSALGSDFTSTL